MPKFTRKSLDEDFIEQLSRKLLGEKQVIVVENIALQNLVKNPKLVDLLATKKEK